MFKTKNKDLNSIKVFERAAPGSVFNQQEINWSSVRENHPYTLLGNEWIMDQREYVDKIVMDTFDNSNKCDLYDTIHRLVFEIMSKTTFGFVDWKGYDYFNYQANSVNRQLMYGIVPLSLWYYYGRRQWFKLLLESIRKAEPDSLVDKLKPFDENSFGELSGIYWGGMFSLTNTITCAIYNVCKNNDELTELNKNSNDTVIKIIKESLRVCAGAPLLTRTLDKDLTIGSYKIPKKSDVMVCPFALHKDPKYWDNSENFDSSRHNSDNSSSDAYYHNGYTPFGVPVEYGGRACVAKDFALMVAERVLITLFTNFKVTMNTKKEYESLPYCGSVKPIHKYTLNVKKHKQIIK